MKIIKFSIIAILLSFMSSCDNRFYCHNDRGIVVNVQKDVNRNEITILLIKDSSQNTINTYVTFLTHKQYNINDTVYFTN